MNIFSLTKKSAPITFSIKGSLPFQNFIFNYNIKNKKPDGSLALHLVRSAIKITAIAVLIFAGLIEKTGRFVCRLTQKGIDLVLTENQKNTVKNKAKEAAAAVNKFFIESFGSLIRSA